jgi:hypothetical protein
MGYGTGTYGTTEYAGLLGGEAGAAPAGPLPTEAYTRLVSPETRGITPGRQSDPVIPYEDRGAKAMPSATYDVRTFVKDPEATKDYYFDWSEILEDGETILTSTWSGGGLTATGGYVLGERTYIFLAGGAYDSTYVVANTVVTSLGRSYTREFRVTTEGT